MKRFTAVAILLVMLCSVFASSPVLSAGEPKTAEPERLGEELELRTKNSETYRLSDGTYECVVFAEDKYYETEAGSLVEIDNSVIASDHVFGGKEYGFTNAANSTHVYFSDNKPSVMISAEKGSVSFEIETDHGVNPSVGGLKDTESISGYLLSGECFISYPEVFENADLVYEVKNGLLKEYIVLNDASAPKEFTFSFDTEGYDIAYTENGTVGFYDGNGELVFELGDLFAVDSADAYTDELTYTIVEKVEENVDITVSLSEDYVNDPERAFPILIDPSVMISGSNKTQDSYVSSKNPTTNYYLNTYIRMGWDSNYNIRRTYIKFSLPASVPSEAITTAYLSLKKNDCGNTPSLKAYIATSSWTSSTITWNNKPSYTTLYASDTAEERTNNWYRFYVTDIVQKWYDGTNGNYGFMVKNTSESGTGNWSTFYSSDAASPNKPELRIVYDSVGSTYYMAFPEDGKMITSNANYNLSKSSYSNGNDYQKWVFSPVGTGVFRIRMKNDLNKCLTANPNTLAVYISDISTNNSNQYWAVYSSGSIDGIYSCSSNANLSGKRIIYNGSLFKLSESTSSSLKLLDADSFIPCSSIHVSNISIALDKYKAIVPSYTPANSSATTSIWTTYTSSNPQIFTVNNNGILHSENIGSAVLTVKNKITNVSCSAEVRVYYPPNPDAQNKDYWCWAAASKMVGEHNSESINLPTGIELLIDTDGLHFYGGISYYGITYDYHYTADAGQRYIVNTICGSDANWGADYEYYISQALSLATGNTLTSSMIGNGTLSSMDIDYMQSELLAGNWVVGIIHESYAVDSHAVVFKYMIENPNVYVIWDPWDNSDNEITLNEANCFLYKNESLYMVTHLYICH